MKRHPQEAEVRNLYLSVIFLLSLAIHAFSSTSSVTLTGPTGYGYGGLSEVQTLMYIPTAQMTAVPAPASYGGTVIGVVWDNSIYTGPYSPGSKPETIGLIGKSSGIAVTLRPRVNGKYWNPGHRNAVRWTFGGTLTPTFTPTNTFTWTGTIQAPSGTMTATPTFTPTYTITPTNVPNLRVETLYVDTMKGRSDGSNVVQHNATRTILGETGQRVIVQSSDLTLSSDGPVTNDGDGGYYDWYREFSGGAGIPGVRRSVNGAGTPIVVQCLQIPSTFTPVVGANDAVEETIYGDDYRIRLPQATATPVESELIPRWYMEYATRPQIGSTEPTPAPRFVGDRYINTSGPGTLYTGINLTPVTGWKAE